MPNSLMTSAEIQQWILRRLGAPFWKVELTADHLEDAVEMARRWFSAKKGVRKQHEMQFFTGITEYALPDFIDTVLDVVFPTSPMDLSMIFSPYILGDEKVPYDVFAAPQSAGLYSTYTQTLQYVESAKRILGAEPDWRQEGRNLLIFGVTKSTGVVVLDYKSHDFTIEQLSERDHELVKRYALACAKKDLARIRSKVTSGLPGAQAPVEFDSARLFQEADQELEQLEKEISLSAFPLGFMVG